MGITIEPQGLNFNGLALDSDGSWSLGLWHKGSLDFSVNKWHSVAITMGDGWQAAAVDGKQLVNISDSVGRLSGTETCDEDTFPMDLTGKQYMGLNAGPSSATTVELCRQACCDMGTSCHIYQFSKSPSRQPECWLGSSKSFSKDPGNNYISRGRDLAGWNLKVSMSRYIFASIDNFEINHVGQMTEGAAFV